MNNPPSLKKPKTEPQQSNGEEAASIANENGGEEEEAELSIQEQEEALLALIEHRTAEVENCRRRVAYYRTQLDIAEKRLKTTQSKLARLRCQDNLNLSRNSVGDGVKEVKIERRSSSPIHISEDSSQSQSEDESPFGDVTPSKSSAHSVKNVKLERRSPSPRQFREDSSQYQPQSRPQLLIPAANPKISQPLKMTASTTKSPSVSGARPSASLPTHVNSIVKLEKDRSLRTSSGQGADENQAKATKRKFEQKEHRDLISLISRSSSPCKISCQTSCVISSQHKRKLRSLILCPVNEQLFVTSALDGVVNLWQIQGKGSSANLLSTTECASLKQRRWPEDIAWHPEGNSLFSVYSADGGDSQISMLNLNKAKGKPRVSFLEEKPHLKGIINNIEFMPWEDTCFVTGGSDHGVLFWTDKNGEDLWKPKALHRNMHSSAVMGVAGMQQKQVVISVGADKRIIGFDLLAGRADYKHQIESKCMSVLPNPCDFNLFMVQTGTPERQLRLFDIRLRQTEIHAFGWKQESSESQSALINQAWSPDGLYLTSGSADPMIHVFDIRYDTHKPSQSIRAHNKRVFKAVWHTAFPLLISISSDLSIGLHKVF